MKWKLTKPWCTEEGDDRHQEFCDQVEDRGFDDSITWSLFTALGEIITPLLKRFRELHSEKIDGPEMLVEIDKMITAFELIRDHDDWDTFGTAEEDKENRKKIEEGLESFKNNWSGLWW
jgi:hypothetical protein